MPNYYEVLQACFQYYRDNPTVGRLLLLWNAEIMYADYLKGIHQ